mmetsp:Transcript_18460/g.25880  ORF Transcript_18460/g.25880 Transcript_18460/m.25880 type:complete len:168 (+) Transcript_18460:226-729(+)
MAMVRSSVTTLSSPSLIEYKGSGFLIFDCPTDSNLDVYLKELKNFNVKYLVRACEPSYSTDKLKAESIQVFDLPFPDGSAPTEQIIVDWLSVVRTMTKEKNGIIGVHCVAGLGRAPVLVAIALIELGASYDDAIEMIREKRKGAINAKQLKFLKSYHPRRKGGCTIM